MRNGRHGPSQMRDSELAFTPYINAYHLNAIYDLFLFPTVYMLYM